MPAERANRPRLRHAGPPIVNPRRARGPPPTSNSNNPDTVMVQRTPTPFPSHIPILAERFSAGIIEQPQPVRPISRTSPEWNTSSSTVQFLEAGGFCYPFSN